MKKVFCFYLFLVSDISNSSSAQNIFINADFENYSTCPTNQGQVPLCNNWIEIVQSADYMNCAYTCWTPQQVVGAQSGTGYMGFATYGSSNASEAIGQFISSPLVTGASYTITFWAKKTTTGTYGNTCTGVSFWGFFGNPASGGSQIGVCPGSMGTGGTLLTTSPLVSNTLWQQFSTSFVAPNNFDFIVMCVECQNCAEYIFVDNFNFVQTTNNFTFSNTCFGTPTNFQAPAVSALDSLIWNFVDPSTGVQNFSDLQNPNHLFSAAGNYNVQLILYYTGGGTDTLTNSVIINTTPDVNLGNDTLLCSGGSLTLDAGNAGLTYQWSNGSNTQSITVSLTGNYSVTVTNGNCSDVDSINVTIGSSGTLNLGNDTTLCLGQSIILNAQNPGSTYAWSTGANTQTINVSNTGLYSVTVTNLCGILNDAINISVASPPVSSLGNDTTYCTSFSQLLNAGNTGTNYLWSTGATTQTINVSTAGNYTVQISNSCGIVNDAILIQQLVAPQVSLGNDTLYCSAFNITLDATNTGSVYSWSTGNNSPAISINAGGTYWVSVSNACGANSDTIIISQNSLPVSTLGNDTLYCDNFSATLNAGINATSILWNDGSTLPTLNVSSPGIYSVALSNVCGVVIDSIILLQSTAPTVDLGKDSIFCGSFLQHFDVSCVACVYAWSNASMNPQMNISSAGETWVQVSNGCGIDRDTVLYQLSPIPYIKLPSDTLICNPDGFVIVPQSTPGKIFWSTGDTTFTTSIHEYGKYFATLISPCGTAEDSIVISECPGEFVLPNAFSPNSDGANDEIHPYKIGNAQLLQFEIYNRWGERIFSTETENDGWDGTLDDRACSMGVYVAVARYRVTVSGEIKMISGNVTLIR